MFFLVFCPCFADAGLVFFNAFLVLFRLLYPVLSSAFLVLS